MSKCLLPWRFIVYLDSNLVTTFTRFYDATLIVEELGGNDLIFGSGGRILTDRRAVVTFGGSGSGVGFGIVDQAENNHDDDRADDYPFKIFFHTVIHDSTNQPEKKTRATFDNMRRNECLDRHV